MTLSYISAMFLFAIQTFHPCHGSLRVGVKVQGTTVGPSFHWYAGKSNDDMQLFSLFQKKADLWVLLQYQDYALQVTDGL